MIFQSVRTPCVGICSTGIGDNVCRGCKRFSHEVIHWNAFTQEQRRVIAQRLESFLVQVVAYRVIVKDVKRLRAQLEHQQVRFQPEQDARCWVFDLLKAGASQITDLADYGLMLKPAHRHLSLPDLKQAIDQDYYQLSLAHYQRYFPESNNHR